MSRSRYCVLRSHRAGGGTGAGRAVRLRLPWREFFPLPGTKGGGPGAYTIQAQMPDVRTWNGIPASGSTTSPSAT